MTAAWQSREGLKAERLQPGSATMVPVDSIDIDALAPQVYAELRRLAARYMRRERPGQTLQATALVHDVYLRLLQDSNLSWQNRAHFFGIAARSMRQILVERARARGAAKRGGSRVRVTLDAGL